jgi:hypothetical protein
VQDPTAIVGKVRSAAPRASPITSASCLRPPGVRRSTPSLAIDNRAESEEASALFSNGGAPCAGSQRS